MQSSAVFCKAHEGAERSSSESLLPDYMTCHKNFGSHTSGGAPIESPLGCMAIPPSSQPTSELMKTCASHTLRLTVRTAPQCTQASEGCVRMLDAQRAPRAAVRVSPVPNEWGWLSPWCRPCCEFIRTAFHFEEPPPRAALVGSVQYLVSSFGWRVMSANLCAKPPSAPPMIGPTCVGRPPVHQRCAVKRMWASRSRG